MKEKNVEETFWTQRYADQSTGWDIGYPSTPIKTYIDQLEIDKNSKILIPGAGNAYEAEYLHQQGYTNVHVLDISYSPLKNLQTRVPTFPREDLIQGDFFSHKGQYDLILEQTFFCSFEPTLANRSAYSKNMNTLLKPEGKLVGLWFDFNCNPEGKRPFGGSYKEYLGYFSPYFNIIKFERCYNSIEPRMGSELFAILKKKE